MPSTHNHDLGPSTSSNRVAPSAAVAPRDDRRNVRRQRAVLALLAAAMTSLVMFALGSVAWAQGDTDRTDGRVPSFEITQRIQQDRSGVTLRIVADVQGLATPEILVVGPDGTLLRGTGTELVFEDLPRGDYLVAATAPRFRLASGTLSAADGDVVHVALILFDQRVQYADEADTPIFFGLFSLDVADNVAEEVGSIELSATPAARMAVIGADGYLEVFESAADARLFEDLESGRYVTAMTAEAHGLTVATVVLSETERVTVAAELESGRP